MGGVLNGLGHPVGGALDEMGEQNGVRSRSGNLRAVGIAEDSGPYKVRQIGAGEYGGQGGTAG